MWTKVRLKLLDERGDFAEDVAACVFAFGVLCLFIIFAYVMVTGGLEQKRIEDRHEVIAKNLEQDFPGIDFILEGSSVYYYSGPSEIWDLCELSVYGYDAVNPVDRVANPVENQEGECQNVLDAARAKATAAPVG